MFYSHTYLARKGPLGTVWCAAHLQHKLKKSHYASTDIPQTVERIIYPEVPLALRMSGHLLLGVVRIYSKKVEYLHHDCNLLWVSLRNAFRAPDVNLPENATQAQFNAVTLPENYALDAVDIDDISLYDGSPDRHLRREEEITLEDQYTTNAELYVRITFGNDIIPDSANSAGSFHGDTEMMQTEDLSFHETLAIGAPGPNQTEEGRELMRGPADDDFHRSSPRVHEHVDIGDTVLNQTEEDPAEVMRDRIDDDFNRSSPVLQPPVKSVTLEHILSPLGTSGKQIETPRSAHIPSLQMQPRQSPQRSGPSSPSPDGAHEEPNFFVAASSEELIVRPSPSPERPLPRRRKRKQYDETLVIGNTFYRNALNDPSDLVKKRKKLPTSLLEMRRFIINKKKEQVFLDPLISGMCTSLENISSQDVTDLNPNLIRSEQSRAAESPERRDNSTAETEHLRSTESPERRDNFTVETEHLRSAESPERRDNFTVETEHLRSAELDPGFDARHVFPSPPRSSPKFHGNAEIPTSPRIPSMVTEPRFDSTINTQYDHGLFTNSTSSDMDTPVMNIGGTNDHLFTGGLSDIPELRNSMESDELLFLEQDSNSPSDSNGSQGDNMSVRTRAVAQYLKNHSPLSTVFDGPPEDLSLNAILEGRRRKLCARMFYETLVLKSCDMIDVRQDEPYADITLVLTPQISKATI